jgi:hypothetical protein
LIQFGNPSVQQAFGCGLRSGSRLLFRAMTARCVYAALYGLFDEKF